MAAWSLFLASAALLLPDCVHRPAVRCGRIVSSASGRGASGGGLGFGQPRKGTGKAKKPKAKAGGAAGGRDFASAAAGTPSEEPQGEPARVQAKPKAKTDRFELQFTCNQCDHRNSHSISRHAYFKGTVIATCPTCKTAHLIADNLNWIEDDFKNIEEFMAKQGTPVTRVAVGEVSDAVLPPPEDPADDDDRSNGGELDKLDGISDDQALRIREAVRARKRQKAQQQQLGE